MRETKRGKHENSRANLKPFVPGDPRINRNGPPRKLPLMKELMKQLLGGDEGQDITETEAGEIVKALIKDAKSGKPQAIAAAKELFERAFGKVKDEVDVTTHAMVWNETKTYKK